MRLFRCSLDPCSADDGVSNTVLHCRPPAGCHFSTSPARCTAARSTSCLVARCAIRCGAITATSAPRTATSTGKTDRRRATRITCERCWTPPHVSAAPAQLCLSAVANCVLYRALPGAAAAGYISCRAAPPVPVPPSALHVCWRGFFCTSIHVLAVHACAATMLLQGRNLASSSSPSLSCTQIS